MRVRRASGGIVPEPQIGTERVALECVERIAIVLDASLRAIETLGNRDLDGVGLFVRVKEVLERDVADRACVIMRMIIRDYRWPARGGTIYNHMTATRSG